MKFTSLTRRFSLSERGHNETSRQDSVVPYSPVPYSFPVQGLGPALLPADPALLEARQLAFEKQRSAAKDRETNNPSSYGISLRKVSTHKSRGKHPLTLGSNSECPSPRTSARDQLGASSSEITNVDLCAALRTYLNYLPLIGNEEDKEEAYRFPPQAEAMETNMRNVMPPRESTTTFCGSVRSPRVLSMDSIEKAHGLLSTGEKVPTGLGIEEIQSLQGKRARNFPSPESTGKELLMTLEPIMAIPALPLRNPARLLRCHASEVVLAASYRWQRRQNKRESLAAGFNSRHQPGELLPRASGQKLVVRNSSQSRTNVHYHGGRDRVQITLELSEKEEEIGSHQSIDDQTIGLGIRVGQQACRQRRNNDWKQIGANESCSSDGAALDSAVPAGGNGNKASESNADNPQSKKIGLGINVYGLCEPFGHSNEDKQGQNQEVEAEDVDGLVKVLKAAWEVSPATMALEMGLLQLTQRANSTKDAGVTASAESTEAVEGLQLSKEVVETVGDGSNKLDLPIMPRLFTREGEYAEVAPTHVVIARDVVVDIGKVEAMLESAGGRDVVPMPAPLSMAARVAVPRKVAASSFSRPPTASLNTSTDLLDKIDNLLEVNYRGQAELFNRVISGASAARSFSTHSGAAATSLRATSNSTAPTSNDNDTPSRLAGGIVHRFRGLETPSAPSHILIHSFAIRHGVDTETRGAASASKPGTPPPSPHVTYGHRFYTILNDNQQLTVGNPRLQPICLPEPVRRGAFYFSNTERQYIDQFVHSEPRGCEQHPNCIECYNTEYAYFENKIMPTTMPPEERNRIISNNRSLRNIKNELEALAETGAISDEQFDTIMNALPAESPLSGAGGARTAQATSPAPPTAALNNLNLGNSSSPPAYTSPPPSLPDRNNPPKPELTRATALYRYAEAGDCNFEVGDEIAVYEYMNADWWLGKNLRTGQEGVFPVNYVQAQTNPTPPGGPGSNFQAQSPYGNEKGNGYGGGYPQQQQQYQGPPHGGPSNPYDTSVPPMQIAAGQPEDNKPNKGAEAGKKFGKKLGNAAIFGAGASIGSNIVNSIF